MPPRTRRTAWECTDTTSPSSGSTPRSCESASPATSTGTASRATHPGAELPRPAGGRVVDRRALLVGLAQQPEAQELRERISQEEESARDARRQTGDRERREGVRVEDVDVGSRRRGDVQ